MANPAKPTALKELHGTAHRNKQRQNKKEPKTTKGIGPAPEHFNELQAKTWDYIVSIMFPGVMCEADRTTMEVLTILFWRFRYGEYEKEAVIPALTAAELGQLTKMLSLYGMTPSDRTKIVQDKNEDKNPFETV